MIKVWEWTPQIGGPILQDKLWYFTGFRQTGTDNFYANVFFNKNAGDPTKWTYDPDTSRRAFQDGRWLSASMRLTYQATPRNKFNIFWDEQSRRIDWDGGGASNRSPEADARSNGYPNQAFNATWSSPVTNRWLLEAGFGGTHLQWGNKERQGVGRLIQVTEQSGIIPGLRYRGQNWRSNWLEPYQLRGSVSYVTGTHTSKVGYTHTWFNYDDRWHDPNSINYRFRNGVPNRLTLRDTDRVRFSKINYLAFYGQDEWALGQLTLQGGVRYDFLYSDFPEQSIGFTKYLPNGFIIPATEGARTHDISPRLAVSYDLTGDGRTAVKVMLGRYVEAQEAGLLGEQLNPAHLLSTGGRRSNSTNRSWNDANGSFVPDCDLLNPARNGECGPFSNQNFGTRTPSTEYDPDITGGLGVRPYNWEFSAQVERELIPGLGVDFGVFRRWFGNFNTTDNRDVVASDFDTFSVTAPADPRLPGGGGYTITGLYDVSEAKFGQFDQLITSANAFGGGAEEWWTGYDVGFNVRLGTLTFRGGVSTGRRTEDFCDLKRQLPELQGATNPWCLQQERFLTHLKGLATYVVPGIDVLVSGTFQSAPGSREVDAFQNVSNSQIVPSLGRNLSGGKRNVRVNLIEPGTSQGERIHQVDLRFAKVLTFGRTRTNVGVDLYNALNVNTPIRYNETYGSRWLQPREIMPARFIKLSMQIDF